MQINDLYVFSAVNGCSQGTAENGHRQRPFRRNGVGRLAADTGRRRIPHAAPCRDGVASCQPPGRGRPRREPAAAAAVASGKRRAPSPGRPSGHVFVQLNSRRRRAVSAPLRPRPIRLPTGAIQSCKTAAAFCPNRPINRPITETAPNSAGHGPVLQCRLKRQDIAGQQPASTTGCLASM